MAKRFVFRLETVLRIRQRREDAAKRVVAERLREVAAVEGEIVALQEQARSETGAFRRTHGAGQLDVSQLKRHRRWLLQLDQAELLARNRLGELNDLLAVDRAALTEARKQVRALEKLKERQHDRHLEELNRAEARENDEIGGVLHLRQRVVATE